MTHDNDRAQLAALHDQRARLAQLERETEEGWRWLTVDNQDMRALFDKIVALKQENERLRGLAQFFLNGYWRTVHIGIRFQRLQVTITQEQLDDLRSQLKGHADE